MLESKLVLICVYVVGIICNTPCCAIDSYRRDNLNGKVN